MASHGVPNNLIYGLISLDFSQNFEIPLQRTTTPNFLDRNFTCGQHKHEILNQLRELAKSEPSIKQDVNPLVRHQTVIDEDEKDFIIQHKIQAYPYDKEHSSLHGDELSSYTWCHDTGEDANEIFLSSTLSGNYTEDSVPNFDTPSGVCSSANLATDGWKSQNSLINDSLGLPYSALRMNFLLQIGVLHYQDPKKRRGLGGLKSISDMNRGSFKQKTG